MAGLISRPDVQMLTLTGIGGGGKTRLATEAAREVADLFPDGVAFVELVPLADPALVAPTILRSLGQGRPKALPLTRLYARTCAGNACSWCWTSGTR